MLSADFAGALIGRPPGMEGVSFLQEQLSADLQPRYADCQFSGINRALSLYT